MRRLIPLFISLFLVPLLVYSQAFFNLTETFSSSDAGIQFGLPEQFNAVINNDNYRIQVTGIDELKFYIYSPKTLELLGYSNDLNRDELIEAFLADHDNVRSANKRSVEGVDLEVVTYDESDVIIMVPLGDTYAIVQSVEWVRARHFAIMLNISASMELLDTSSSSERTFAQTIESEETGLTFQLPDRWTVEYSADRRMLTLDSRDVELDVFTPQRIKRDGLGDKTKLNELLASIMELYDWEQGDFDTWSVGDRVLTIGEYSIDDFDGMLVGVPLDNGEFVVIDTVEWTIGDDDELVIDIASTFQSMEMENATATLTDPDGDWRGVIDQLEEDGLIGMGGDIVFVEDRAFFSGQGNWFTPLAENSPQTNFVMAASLTYTAGEEYNFGKVESCALLSRLKADNSTGITSQFLEVGIDNSEVLYYNQIKDNTASAYDEFNVIELGNSYHVLFIVQGESLTIFLDGELIGQDLPIDYGVGTFGIGLRGLGAEAECVGENIWVYRIPEIQDGVCQATSSSNVNQRQGPATSFPIVGQLTANSAQDVVGRTIGEDGYVWWLLENDAWVRNDVVELLGDCRDVPPSNGDI